MIINIIIYGILATIEYISGSITIQQLSEILRENL